MNVSAIPTLREIATARSGDKGNHANIAVVANDLAAFTFLQGYLTTDRVKAWLSAWDCGEAIRYELPGLGAFNFVLFDALAGGASRSLRLDTQGKLLGTAILSLPLDRPSKKVQENSDPTLPFPFWSP